MLSFHDFLSFFDGFSRASIPEFSGFADRQPENPDEQSEKNNAVTARGPEPTPTDIAPDNSFYPNLLTTLIMRFVFLFQAGSATADQNTKNYVKLFWFFKTME